MSDNEDKNHIGYTICKSHGGGRNERGLLKRYVISKLSRKDLEDKFCTSVENNLILKKRLNLQEEKLKLLGTKLLRLTAQQKKEHYSNAIFQPLDKTVREQESRIEELEDRNSNLIDEICSLKKQICAQQYLITSSKLLKVRKSNSELKNDSESNVQIPDKKKLRYGSSPSEGNLVRDKNSNCFNEQESDANDNNSKEIKDLMNSIQNQEISNEGLCNCNTIKNDKTTTYNKDIFSILKSKNKSKKFVKNMANQTSFQDNEDLNVIIEQLSKELADEKLLVSDLENKLESSKLTKSIILEVEECINQINEKKRLSKDKIEKKTCDDDNSSTESLSRELQKEKINLKAQMAINDQLISKLTAMQEDLDSLKIQYKNNDQQAKSNRKEKNLICCTSKKKKSEEGSPKKIKSPEQKYLLQDKDTIFDASPQPVIETISTNFQTDLYPKVETKSTNIQTDSYPIVETKASNIQTDSYPRVETKSSTTQTGLLINTLVETKSIQTDDITYPTLLMDKSVDNNQANQDIKMKTVKKESTCMNCFKRSTKSKGTKPKPLKQVKPKDDKKNNSIDDATYSISKKNTFSKSYSESSTELSDGEIPMDLSFETDKHDKETTDVTDFSEEDDREIKPEITSCLSAECKKRGCTPIGYETIQDTSTEMKAESTLKAISKEIENFKLLLNPKRFSANKDLGRRSSSLLYNELHQKLS